MAQGYYEGPYAPQSTYGAPAGADRGIGVGRLLNAAGALLSVVLVAGVGVWSYRLMVRDVTGVPVIRALGGPVRLSPEDPGGRQAAYQGLAVNSVAAAEGTAAAPQVIALAPQAVELNAEDRAGAALRSEPIAVPAPLALDAPLAAPVELAAVQVLPDSVPGLARSPLPRPRPGRVAASGGQAVAAVSPGGDAQAEALLQELVTRLSGTRTADVDPASLAPGTRMVQLGVYEDATAARTAWDTMASRFPAYLEGRGRVVEPAISGGRTFYRLRALGFADEPEARRFCTVFRAESIDCVPTLVR